MGDESTRSESSEAVLCFVSAVMARIYRPSSAIG